MNGEDIVWRLNENRIQVEHEKGERRISSAMGIIGGPLVMAASDVSLYTCGIVGIPGGAALLAAITSLINLNKKKDSEKLFKTMDKLSNKIADLRREYAIPENPKARAQHIRVNMMSENMLLSTGALMETFKQIRDMARSTERELQSILFELH
ncbi:hypothetical protein INT47_011227 [Mucor saturninus]|uniref:Uncharacterized protein n=1 Tax=Mucor saturninus TaxID=64648 RepID=A0A8H7RM55_9FUNG|nr:hypothetical protein INT47_011227 [Mucor saturninus]